MLNSILSTFQRHSHSFSLLARGVTRHLSTNSQSKAQLEVKDLMDLINGETSFLRVSNFIPKEVCGHAVKNLTSNYEVEEYSNAQGVMKVSGIGLPYFEATSSALKREQYYKIAAHSIRLTRQLFEPYQSPMDKLRLELDEKWMTGSSLLNLGEGKMFCGLIRVLQSGVLAHEDKLERDHGFIPSHITYRTQLAANIYLKTPEIGGELCSWKLSLEDEEYNNLRGESYGIAPDRLSYPEVIKPEQGDLILFNARNLHAITKGEGGERISISTFILFGDENQPLYFWS